MGLKGHGSVVMTGCVNCAMAASVVVTGLIDGSMTAAGLVVGV